jgi:glycosyltransferase involved in cell wall biosynthesis
MKIAAPFMATTSYSQIAKNLTETLVDLNYDFSYSDVSDRYFLKKSEKATVGRDKLVQYMAGKHLLMGSVVNFKNYEADLTIPMFSTSLNRLPKSVINRLGDRKVIAMNEFTEKTLMNSGFYGEIIKSTILNNINSGRRLELLPYFKDDRLFLLTICDFNHPNWSQVIESYYNAFKKSDSVVLVALIRGKSWNKYQQAEIIAQIRQIRGKFRKKLPEISFIGSEMTDLELIRLYKTCDCYIKLHSDVGLSHLDAMSANMINIGPETGPTTEFLTNKNGFLISKTKEIRFASKNELNGMPYDIYSSEQLIQTMKHVYDNHVSVKENLFKERRITVSQFDRSVVVPKLISVYKKL